MAFLDTGPLNSRSRPSFTIAPPRNTVPPPDISCTRGPPELSFKPRSRVNPAVLMVPQKVPIAITPGLSTKNDHESPPPSPLDQGENVPSAISLPLRVQPQTPPAASGPHQLLPSPPPSSERPTSVISDFQYAILAPYLQPPKVPSAIHLLTADLFPKLAANAHSSALTIPCLPQQFSVWRTRNSHWLQDFDSRWEYSSREGLFIIKCMPTPIHEAFSMHATCVIHEELRKITSLRASSTNISVATNTGIYPSPYTYYSNPTPLV
ncbi:hypothetical protein L211DRAFT_231713 [Terfezia boudieri ATCC MYA-4762]|uniref:Uncharacterized protein n=1 Tax=Terfezia boudieri ATCC MYA-4762 TaxID=1051890 RepID=A0A3N4LQM2_9PEZI|nr:hypothetical protein L211DRAFT_231713 [Terfezia boudieri ATCC MYA-4762]